MRRILPAALGLAIAAPATANDFNLMVGFRSTMAASIRDYGYRCPDVKDYVPVGFADDGRVLKVFCGPMSGGAPGDTTAYRVVAYLDGEVIARPWSDKNERLQ